MVKMCVAKFGLAKEGLIRNWFMFEQSGYSDLVLDTFNLELHIL